MVQHLQQGLHLKVTVHYVPLANIAKVVVLQNFANLVHILKMREPLSVNPAILAPILLLELYHALPVMAFVKLMEEVPQSPVIPGCFHNTHDPTLVFLAILTLL